MIQTAQHTSSDLILSIDVGTQSVRFILFDRMGEAILLIRSEIEPYFSEAPGRSEQHPEYYLQKLIETSQRFFAELSTADKNRIRAVTLTTQRGTVINLDKNAQPLRPAMVWLDQRLADVGAFPQAHWRLALRTVGQREAVIHAIKNAECNWIMQNQPEIWAKTDKYLFLSGYLCHKLTGKFVDSVGSIVGYQPFNYKKQEWAGSSHLNYKMFPVERNKLPDLVRPGEVLGTISAEISAQTGIPAGLPLIAAASDKACEVLGSGVFAPGTACLSYGTTATVQTTHEKYFELIPFFPSYPSAIPGFFNTEIMIYRGFWMINWFKQQFGHRELQLSLETGMSPEYFFDEMIRDIPPGSMGLTLQPYWSPGVKRPGTEAKGAIIGFGDVHTRAHVYRAILEGLAYALKEGLDRTVKRTGRPVSKLIVSGGGSQSPNAMQLTADIFNLPAEKPPTYETSALGAAINAAVGLGYYANYAEAVKNMCRTGEIYQPNAKNAALYRELYQDVYLKMYRRLRPLYANIRKIIRYPEKL